MRAIILLGLICLYCPPVPAEEEPAKAPRTPEEFAARLVTLHSAGETAAFKAYALRDSPDPWVVAAELCRRGAHDVGIAFAKAGLRPATLNLKAYVEGRRGKPESEAVYRALAATKASPSLAPSPRHRTNSLTSAVWPATSVIPDGAMQPPKPPVALLSITSARESVF